MITSILYALMGYGCWFLISRCALLAAWLYGRPMPATRLRHWLILLVGGMPLCLEFVSTILVVFSIAFGVDPRPKE